MVTLLSFVAFLIVGIMWGTSDAFMEVGSKNTDSLLSAKQNKNSEDEGKKEARKGSVELENFDKLKDKKKKEKKKKESKLERKKTKKQKRSSKKKRFLGLSLKRKGHDSMEDQSIIEKEEIQEDHNFSKCDASDDLEKNDISNCCEVDLDTDTSTSVHSKKQKEQIVNQPIQVVINIMVTDTNNGS
jgi:hypothetical protein